ncbi:MAG TPA: hypothetical protein VM098_08545 [Phycisphaerae bacterium]|nr:hypothetical protein [Phycisphaerae bacterium]
MTARRAPGRLHADQAGQTTVEWAIILVVVALPMYCVFRALVEVMAAHYKMLTFLETLPFP